jgi:alpha-glucoside transport system substrate-binding protein
MTHHLRRLLALALALTLIAAACGDDDDGVTTRPGDDPDAVDLSGQSIEVMGVWSGSEQANFERVLSEFEDRTGAEVNYTSAGDDIPTVLGTSIEGGSPPDVAVIAQPGLLNDLVADGALVDIEDAVGDLVDEHYADDWRELGSVDGTLYGVWFKAANKSTVWYHIDLWDEAGVEPPDTWEDFLTAAETLRDSGVTPVAVGGADGWTLTDWFENVYLRSAGPELYDQLTDHEIPWTHESVREALEILAELFGGEGLINDDALGTDFPTSVAMVFAQEEAATVYEGDFVADVISDDTDAELGVEADFFDFPSVDGSGPAVVGGGDVAVLLEDTEAGREFMRFLATPEAAEIWAQEGGFTSPNQSVDLDVYPDEITRRSAEALTEAETFRFDLSDLQPSAFGGTPGQGLFQLFQDFLANPDDIDTVTEQMEAEASRAFGG